MQRGYDPYPSEYNFRHFTRLQPACSYQGKLQTNCAVLTFCDFKHRVMRRYATSSWTRVRVRIGLRVAILLNLNLIFAKCKKETRPKTICIKLPIVPSFCVRKYKNYIHTHKSIFMIKLSSSKL